jgi:hypothetical protein
MKKTIYTIFFAHFQSEVPLKTDQKIGGFGSGVIAFCPKNNYKMTITTLGQAFLMNS